LNNYKILIITSEFPPGPGGIGNHAYNLSKALSKKGYEITVLTDEWGATKSQYTKFDKEHCQYFKTIRIARNSFTLYFRRIAAANKLITVHDKIFLSGKFPVWIAGFLAKFYPGKMFLAIVHGSEINLNYLLARKFFHFSLGLCNKIIAVSKFTESLLPQKLQNQSVVIPNGIDLDELKSLNMEKDFVMKGNPKILTVGNVTPRKGQHRVISALPDIMKKYPDACYHIVGLSTYKKQFQQCAQDLNVSGSVVFHGLSTREQLVKAYKEADIFIMLSENQKDGDVEGFGIAILEANFFGLPAIGAKYCGIEDAIDNSKTGYLVDGAISEEITMAVEKCLNNLSYLKVNAVEWAYKHGWDNIVTKYEKALEI
jgi:phosphatidylinositol alpha-1,6-mannosyltransferase